MNNGNRQLLALLGLLMAAPAFALQDNAEEELRRQAVREAAQQQRDAERAARAEARDRESARRDAERDRGDMTRERERVAAEMRRAEARLEEAARRIAELSSQQMPGFNGQNWAFEFSGRPVLGITIDGDTESGPVEGVRVSGVTPGGAAFEAGLRAGDVITTVNDESLTADSSAAANGKLLDFMKGVEEGDTLQLEFLRDGKQNSVELQPEIASARHYAYSRSAGMPPLPPMAPMPRVTPSPSVAPRVHEFMIWRNEGGWGDMEMVTLTEDLGRYFGTDKGLLVVRAPAAGDLELKDGDVIHAIDGREPASIAHAMRILASYQPGEQLKIDIMRDKRKRTLEVEIPVERRSAIDVSVAPDVVVDVRREVSN